MCTSAHLKECTAPNRWGTVSPSHIPQCASQYSDAVNTACKYLQIWCSFFVFLYVQILYGSYLDFTFLVACYSAHWRKQRKREKLTSRSAHYSDCVLHYEWWCWAVVEQAWESKRYIQIPQCLYCGQSQTASTVSGLMLPSSSLPAAA